MTGMPRPSRVTIELMPRRTDFMAEVYRERLAIQADGNRDHGQHPVRPIVVMVIAARLVHPAAHGASASRRQGAEPEITCDLMRCCGR